MRRLAGLRLRPALRLTLRVSLRLALSLLFVLPGCQFLPVELVQTATRAPQQPAAGTSAPEHTATAPASLVLISRSLHETGEQPRYELDARWPVLEWPGDPRAEAFNQAAQGFVTAEVTSFRESIQGLAPDPNFDAFGSSLHIRYVPTHQEHGLLGILFGASLYVAGAAHPAHYSHAINYDLRQGRVIGLAELFRPGSPYLQRLSDLCLADLKARGVIEWENGVQPDAENFAVWNLTPSGIMITFDPYQVASYAAGAQTVILPYSQFSDLLAADGPLAVYLP